MTMATLVRYLTHPQVQIDPAVPVPQWGLSELGRQRTAALAAAGWLQGTSQIVASAERKAIETAEILAAPLGVEVERRQAMHENDRSSTGFLAPDEFEKVADQFFANPKKSIRGWERALDAQARIVREAEHLLRRDIPGDVLLVGHGAVGTLLYCHYAGLPIARAHDQPGGGGHYMTLIKEGRRLIHGWRKIEDPPKESD